MLAPAWVVMRIAIVATREIKQCDNYTEPCRSSVAVSLKLVKTIAACRLREV